MTGNDSLFAQSRCGAFKIKPDDARLDEFLTKHKITISADDIAKLNSITDLKLRQYVKFSILYNLFLKKWIVEFLIFISVEIDKLINLIHP